MESSAELSAISVLESPSVPLHPGDQPAEVLIEPSPRWPRIDLEELWAYRGLLFFLVWRDIKVRYAQTVLGAGWALVQPVMTVLVFTVIFGHFAQIPSDGVPYAAFSLAAMVPWTYFATALSGSSNSLVASSHLITKVYFPRLIIPLAPVLAGLVDFAIAFLLLVAVILFYGLDPQPIAFVLLPCLLLAMMLVSAGVGLWLSALNIQYRDVKYITPFLVQVWMYASPIVYPISIVPERFRWAYALNPMTGIIEGFRTSLLGTGSPVWSMMAVSWISSIVLFVSGALYFRSVERVFADVV